MKKSNLLTTAAAVMLLTATAATAQTCIKTPSCADLGYTKTADDCSGKTILKCPLDNTQVYCPGYEETLRTYKVGDTYVDANGVALGRVITVTNGGQHGRIMSSTPYFITDYSRVTSVCLDKTTGGRDWYMSTGLDLFNNKTVWNCNTETDGLGIVNEGCYWTSNGCCQLEGCGSTPEQPCWNSCFGCGYNSPQDFKKGWSVYCVTDF